MKVEIHGLNGETKGEKTLPETFTATYRPDLIQRAHLAEKSSQYQPKGTDSKAGLKNTAEYIGRRGAFHAIRGTGLSKTPRTKYIVPGKGRAARKVPYARTGRRAHPPKTEKKLKEKINKKEKRKALKSAIAATTQKETVEKRGHKTKDLELPIIVENDLEQLKKTREVANFLKEIGLEEEIEKSQGRKINPGKGKGRGRKYHRRRSVLIVPGQDKGIKRAARNIPGVDIVLAENLNVSSLAPGGEPGRITIYTENALEKIGEENER